jgi:hypothetical protein
VTWEYDVSLMVSRGFTSETFAYEAVQANLGRERPYVIYALYDFDRSGADATRTLKEKLERFGQEHGVEVRFHHLGLTRSQVRDWNLSTRPHKCGSAADQRWPYPFACELDAMPPDHLRALVRDAIEQHLPSAEFFRLKRIEQAERDTLQTFLEGMG